jgi:uncharacterized protein with HEPN domain
VKDPHVLVLHALECIGRVERFTAAGENEFRHSDLIQGAVLHNLQTMAQSIIQLPDALKAGHPEVDWRSLVGFRNILVHDYLGVSVPRVWDIVQSDLPAVRSALESMRRELESA